MKLIKKIKRIKQRPLLILMLFFISLFNIFLSQLSNENIVDNDNLEKSQTSETGWGYERVPSLDLLGYCIRSQIYYNQITVSI